MLEQNIQQKLRDEYKIDISKFSKLNSVNKGGFGSVYKVKEKETQKIYAAKIIPYHDKIKQMINREISIMIRVQHPTLIKFYGYSLIDINKDQNVTILMEYSENGSLLDCLEKVRNGLADPKYDNTARQKILVGITRGMMFLHQHHIIHRDLKPGNVLLDSNLHPHIIDFGCSKFYEIGKDPSTTSNLGTLFYMAPESIFDNKYSEKSDVYSFGCLMFEVVTDQELYPELKNLNSIQIMAKMASHQIQKPEFKNHVKKTIEDLIKRCWSDDPDKRPTFEELFHKLAHNSEEWIIDVFDENKTDNEYDVFKYFLDDVDSEEVFSYVDEINELEQFDQLKIKTDKLEEENKHLKKEVESLKKKVKPIKDITDRLKSLEMQFQKLSQGSIAFNKKEIEVPFNKNEEDEMKGIISYIGQGNPQNEIDLSSSSLLKSELATFALENVFMFDDDVQIFHSKNEPDSWLAYDFKDRKIKLKAYSIKEHMFVFNSYHMISWKIEASNDNQKWVTLDSHENDRSICKCGIICTFNIQSTNESNQFYRYIRIKQTGPNTKNNNFMAFSAMEFFGTIIDS